MNLQGRLDAVAADAVTGWVRDLSDPARTVEVVLESGGETVATTMADLPRDDLRALKLPGACGFAFSLHDVSVADPSTLRVRVVAEGWVIGESPILMAELRDERPPAAALPHPPRKDRPPPAVRLATAEAPAAQERLRADVETIDRLLNELRSVLARSVIEISNQPVARRG